VRAYDIYRVPVGMSLGFILPRLVSSGASSWCTMPLYGACAVRFSALVGLPILVSASGF